MTFYYLIFIVVIALYVGYTFYLKSKNARQADVVDKADFKAESANAERYKSKYLAYGWQTFGVNRLFMPHIHEYSGDSG